MAIKPLSTKDIGEALEELREWSFEFRLGRRLLIRQIDFRGMGFASESILLKFLSERVLPLAIHLRQYISFQFISKGVVKIEITTAEQNNHITAKDIRFARKFEEFAQKVALRGK